MGVRLLDAPVSRRDDPRAHQYIVDHVNPGTTIRRRIIVANPSPLRREFAVYPAAATVDKDEWTVAPARTANELSSWITVDHDHLNLNPEQEATVWATIRVPEDASVGERYAVIWAETAGRPDDGPIRAINRAGIRVYLSVGPGGEPPFDFTIGDIAGTRAPDGTAILTARVVNTGKRALDLDGTLSLTDGPDGLGKGPFKVEAPTLAIGATTNLEVPVGQHLPDGPWTATLELASGWTKRSATARVTFAPPGVTKPASDSDHSHIILVGGLATSALVLALLVGYARRQRRLTNQPVILRAWLPTPPFNRASDSR
ncbi:hypothetical protein [Micromonospora sp. ATCC 39149]|uniref:Peptidase n=1 Tax=Micromonospora carbonacea TaxID=47853 RepID=A0A7D5Y5T8_9ACTN|nr:hypothetical protein [Micromonospora sp. ATCC 39149]QLJ98418.1 hypothetical protein HZU44_27675 [Micromonospora carbonacea]